MTVATRVRQLEKEYGQLLASHERARSLDEFSRWENDPVGFIRDVLHGEPWEAQQGIAAAVCDNRHVVVRSCNALGKDWLAARLALWWALARRGLVLITGPTQRQVVEIVMGEVARAFMAAEDLPGDLYQTALRLGRGEEAGILAFTSTETSKLTGFHAARLLGVITEGQGVEPHTYEAMLACAAGADDRLLVVGNPLRPVGRFFQISTSPHWVSIRVPASGHPNVREGRAVIPGAVTREFVATIAREYGRDSSVYRSRVEAEFPDEDTQVLVRRSWLERAAEIAETGELEEQARHGDVIFAVDVARFGPDSSCLLVAQGPVVRELVTWKGAALTETVGKVIQKARRVESQERRRKNRLHQHRKVPRTIVVDEPGLGGGVIDRLREHEYRVAAFNGARRARDPNRYANVRAEAYWTVREMLAGERLALPRNERLAEELLAIEWSLDSSGRIALPPKDQLRASLRRSPDAADTLAMACWHIEKGGKPKQRGPVFW